MGNVRCIGRYRYVWVVSYQFWSFRYRDTNIVAHFTVNLGKKKRIMEKKYRGPILGSKTKYPHLVNCPNSNKHMSRPSKSIFLHLVLNWCHLMNHKNMNIEIGTSFDSLMMSTKTILTYTVYTR